MNDMYILAIDTSCDETSVAVSKDTTILSNIISSQVELHKPFGGVVPSVAKRAHQERIDLVIQKALKTAKLSSHDIDVFAVTYGPGLAPALEVGVEKAKELSLLYKKPLAVVNHMEGHLYAVEFRRAPLLFPSLALLVSGNHTELVFVKNPSEYEILGETVDDAAGEAFDKVARMLGLGYPGGKILAQFAKQGDPTSYPFPLPMARVDDLNFSFSGIKAAAMRLIKQLTSDDARALTKKEIEDIAASFQTIAVKHLVRRTQKTLERMQEHIHFRSVILGGGVSANLLLREELRKLLKQYHIPLFYPKTPKLCMDNAAMIAIVAFHKAQRKEYVHNIQALERNPNARLDDVIV